MANDRNSRSKPGRTGGGSRSGSKPSGGSRGGDSRSGDKRAGSAHSARKRGSGSRSGGPRDARGGSRDARDSRGRDDRGGEQRPGGRGRNERGGSSGQDRSGQTWQERTEERQGRPEAGPKSWGGVARRGAAKVGEVPFTDQEEFTPEEVAKYEERVAKRAAADAARQRVRDEAKEAVDRAGGLKPTKRRPPTYAAQERSVLPAAPKTPVEPEVALIKALGRDDGRKAWKNLLDASGEFADGRYRPAETKLKKLASLAPEVPEIHELLGLTLYRQEKWAAASKELELFREMAGSTEQHPVLADAYRAQRRWADVEELWVELREVSPSAALVTEGRIVAAGAQADQGDLNGAIRTLEKKWKRPKKPREHHLSRAYALADLYERAGDSPRARDLFAWVAASNPYFSDAATRAR